MRTVQLEKREGLSSIQNKVSSYTNLKNKSITSRTDVEIIIANLKAKIDVEEEQKEINKFIIQLLFFMFTGLFFIYFYIENF